MRRDRVPVLTRDMCGIVGYVGDEYALPHLLNGMRRLEYRGYDSAGVAVVEADRLLLARRAGRVDDLEGSLPTGRFGGKTGIGHTRWATHGPPSEVNAHPHLGCTGRIAIVHNGIIENHAELREELSARGHTFTSQTDSEVAAHLIESMMRDRGSGLLEAVLAAVDVLAGSYALVCITSDEPNHLVAVRNEPPLVVAAAPQAGVVASDITALLDHSRDVVPLPNRCIADVTAEKISLYDFAGDALAPERVHVGWEPESAEKGGFEDFMLKEIYEQPRAVRDTVRGRIERGAIVLDEMTIEPDEISSLSRIVVVACGTSFHAGMLAKHSIERLAGIPVELDLASEFRYRKPLLGSGQLVIGITQSGETADTLAATRYAREMGCRIVAVTNVLGSSIAREADAVLFTRAGPEIGVAATKTFVTQVVAVNLLALYLAQATGSADPEAPGVLDGLWSLPDQIEDVLSLEPEIRRAAKRYADRSDFLFIGRGVGTAIAMEGALKLKEISYAHAEAYPAGELKHGAIALIEPGFPVVAIATDPGLRPKMLANVEEVRARGGETIVLTQRGDRRSASLANELLELPVASPLLSPVLDAIVLQLFAYHVAKERGLAPDRPRNLAKSVTVE